MKTKKSAPKKSISKKGFKFSSKFFIGLATGVLLVLITFFVYLKFFSSKMTPPENEYLRNCENQFQTIGCSSGEVCCRFTMVFYGPTQRCAPSAQTCLTWGDGTEAGKGQVVKTY